MKRLILKIALLFSLSLLISQVVDAAGVLPRFRRSGGTAAKGTYSGVLASPRLRSDRKALLVTFNNLQKVKNVTYTLMYQTDGKDEGVSGSIDSSAGNSLSRELLFGTCSSGVCRYHANISNMKLEILTELPSGKRLIKRFRVRI